MTSSELPAITKISPTKLVPEILQQQHFINTCTNPEGCNMSNFIRQDEINIAKRASQSSTTTSGKCK